MTLDSFNTHLQATAACDVFGVENTTNSQYDASTVKSAFHPECTAGCSHLQLTWCLMQLFQTTESTLAEEQNKHYIKAVHLKWCNSPAFFSFLSFIPGPMTSFEVPKSESVETETISSQD